MITPWLLLLIFPVLAQQTQCKLRREWDSLDQVEKKTFIAALQCILTQKSLNHSTPTLSLYEDFVYHHYAIAPSVHLTPLFLPFHRLFTLAFETALQKCNSRFANVSVPYWDVAVNANDISAFSGFRNEYFGSNGTTSDNCVTNGVAAGRIATYPTVHCLKRAFDYSLISEFAFEEIALGRLFAINPTGSYNLFRTQLESTIHAGVHFGLGGIDIGDMAAAEWQTNFPALANSFDGLNEFNKTVSVDDWIDLGLLRSFAPFDAAHQIRVKDSFQLCGSKQYALSGNVSTGVWVQKQVSDMSLGMSN